MKRKIIISGHSNGLGRALAEYYLRQGDAVLGLSRRQVAVEPSEKLQQHIIDLSDSAAVAALFSDGLIADFMHAADEVVLINNAGTVQPSAMLGRQNDAEIITSAALNITAPLLLANEVCRQKPANAVLKIVHISSGAGRNAYPGWSVYGAGKAALDHHARCVAAEQLSGVRIASIAPGVIDTGMQAQIRASDTADFPMLARFQDLKAQGGLSSAEEIAAHIAAMIADRNFGKAIVQDVRDWQPSA